MCPLHHKHLTPMAGIMQEAHRCLSWRVRSLRIILCLIKLPCDLLFLFVLSLGISCQMLSLAFLPKVTWDPDQGARGACIHVSLTQEGREMRVVSAAVAPRDPLPRKVAFQNECTHLVISGFPAQYVNPAVVWWYRDCCSWERVLLMKSEHLVWWSRDCCNWERVLLIKSDHWQGEVTLLFWTDTVLFLDGVSANIKCLPFLNAISMQYLWVQGFETRVY